MQQHAEAEGELANTTAAANSIRANVREAQTLVGTSKLFNWTEILNKIYTNLIQFILHKFSVKVTKCESGECVPISTIFCSRAKTSRNTQFHLIHKKYQGDKENQFKKYLNWKLELIFFIYPLSKSVDWNAIIFHGVLLSYFVILGCRLTIFFIILHC